MRSDNERLQGRRYIALARCSTDQQAETSLPDQLRVLRAFGDEHGMVFVDSVARDVTGSVPGARTEFAKLIQQKRERDDFDVLLVQDMSRLTRGGAQHAFSIEQELNGAGIEIVYAASCLPEGDEAELVKSVHAYANQQYVKNLSFGVARGGMSAVESRRIPHCLRMPYGVDRLIVSLDGRPLFVIRNLADGTQAKLDPVSGEVIEKYGADSRKHYRLQSNERVVLVPGEKSRHEAVVRMLRRRLVDGWGGFRIAKELETMGILSGSGKSWNVTSINNILRNPTYTGTGVANRYTKAIYYCRAPDVPMVSGTDRGTLVSRTCAPMRVRSEREWIRIDHPKLRDYLGDLREAAERWQAAELAKQARGAVTRASKDRHVDSPFLLKGIVTVKQGGYLMTGRTSGAHRYYAVARGFTVPSNDRTLRRLFPAAVLERAVLDQLSQVLADADELRLVIAKTLEAGKQARGSDERGRLERERTKLARQLELAIESLGSAGREIARQTLQRIERKIGDIDLRLKSFEAEDEPYPELSVDQVATALGCIAERVHFLSAVGVRRLLAAFVGRVEVDLATKDVEIEFSLPDWATIQTLGSVDAVSLDNESLKRSGIQANASGRASLASISCTGHRHVRKPLCLTCRRRTAA